MASAWSLPGAVAPSRFLPKEVSSRGCLSPAIALPGAAAPTARAFVSGIGAPRVGGEPGGPPIGGGALECPPRSSWGPALGSLSLRDLPGVAAPSRTLPRAVAPLVALPGTAESPRALPEATLLGALCLGMVVLSCMFINPILNSDWWTKMRPARCWCAANGPHRCGGALRGPPRVGTPKDFPSSGGIPRCLLRGAQRPQGPPRSGGASRKIPWGGVEQKRPPKGIGAHRGPLRGICYHSGPFRDDGIPGVLTSEMAPPWALPDTWFPLWTIIGAATSLGGPPKAGGAPRGPP
ncbi:uncharacterized protein LOC121872235 [Homarus americanus]|uniref:uncharacterized protein LOC121872235 n=1 Tax=Homarus americanus TaxID=6706 RepID=UPI001C46A82D|nr:uncharacterized protein LOC121872235 [Homarus americanus]